MNGNNAFCNCKVSFLLEENNSVWPTAAVDRRLRYFLSKLKLSFSHVNSLINDNL